jgi:hypothetical protein
MMDFQRKADAAIVVSGEGFTARGWKFTALKEYLRDTYAASVVGEPKTQGDLSVVVRIGDGSKISASDLVTEICRRPTHLIADNTISLQIKPIRKEPSPPQPRTKEHNSQKNETVSIDVTGEERYIVSFIYNNMGRRREFKQGLTDCNDVEWKEDTHLLTIHGRPPAENVSYWKQVIEKQIVDELKRYKVEPIRLTEKTSWDSLIVIVDAERKKHNNAVETFELLQQRKVLIVGKEADVQSVYRSVSQRLSESEQYPPKEEPKESGFRRSLSHTSFADHEVQIDKRKRPIMSFIFSHPQHKSKLQHSIDNCSSIKWNKQKGILSLEWHPLDQDGTAHTWSQRAEDRVEEFLEKYNCIPVTIENDHCWERKVKMIEEELEHEDEVGIEEVQEESKILLVGLKACVNDVHKSVKDTLSRFEQREDKKQPTEPESVVVVKKVSPDLFELMSRTMQFKSVQSDVTVEYKAEKLCLNISGAAKAIRDASDTLEAVRDEMKQVLIPLESHAREFLSSMKGIEQFNTFLESRSIIAKAIEAEKDELKVYLSRGEGGKVKDELRKFVHSETIEVDGEEIAKYLDSSDCQQFLENIQGKFGVAVTCAHSSGKPEKVVIVGQEDKVAEAKDKIELQLYKHGEACETVPLAGHAVAEFIRRYMESDIKAIENEQSQHETQVKVRDDVTPPVIEYRCKKTGVPVVSKRVQALIEKCKGSTSKEFKKHGLKKLVSKSFTFHHKVEKDRKVVIQVQQDQSVTYQRPTLPPRKTPSSAKLKSGLNVVVVQGDLSIQQVDVIVSSAADTLDLQAAQASKVLAQKAGPGLQHECSTYVQSHGSLKQGDLVVTRGYNLRCKRVLHGRCPADKQVSLIFGW